MTTSRIAHLDACIEQAQTDLSRCRDERAALIESLSPYKVGDEFEAGTRKYKVRHIRASPKTSSVYLDCYYWTGSKNWSWGTKLVSFPVVEAGVTA